MCMFAKCDANLQCNTLNRQKGTSVHTLHDRSAYLTCRKAGLHFNKSEQTYAMITSKLPFSTSGEEWMCILKAIAKLMTHMYLCLLATQCVCISTHF